MNAISLAESAPSTAATPSGCTPGASLLEYLHACPVCSHSVSRHYCRVPSLFNSGEFIRYERCADCGTVFRNPRLPAAYRINRYVEKILPADAKRLDPKSQVHYWYMMQVIRRLRPAATAGRLLDFGCGAGGFLLEARAAGFDVMGLEVNRDLAAHILRTYDIPVYQGLVDDSAFAPERFDVIISSQVFEHLLDPCRTLRELRDHLRPSGLILIEFPNLHDIRERLRRGATMDDSHLFYFSRRSLGRLLGDAGFRVLAVQEGLRPYRFLGEHARDTPLWLLSAGERLTSLCQIKTVLSVVAVLA
jgi:SAM-dependent methyltransferase